MRMRCKCHPIQTFIKKCKYSIINILKKLRQDIHVRARMADGDKRCLQEKPDKNTAKNQVNQPHKRSRTRAFDSLILQYLSFTLHRPGRVEPSGAM